MAEAPRRSPSRLPAEKRHFTGLTNVYRSIAEGVGLYQADDATDGARQTDGALRVDLSNADELCTKAAVKHFLSSAPVLRVFDPSRRAVLPRATHRLL